MHTLTRSETTGQQSAGTDSRLLRSKAILVAMTQLGGLQIILAGTGLVRNKVAAIYLKTTGIGEWSQILGVATTVFLIVQFGMIVALSRNAAAAQTDEDRQRQLSVANTLTTAVAFAAILAAAAVFLTSPSYRLLSNLGISAAPGRVLLLLIALLAPFEGLRNNYLSFLQGVLDIRGIAAKRSIAVILATAVAIPLVIKFGITGACLQFALVSVLLSVLLGHRCYQLGYRPIQFQWERSTVVGLATLGGASLLVSFAFSLVDVLIRSQLICYAGLSEAGIYQAAFLLSSQVTQIVLGSIGVFSLASISGSTVPEVISQRLRAMYKVVLPISAVGLGLLGLLERPAVQLLFSSQFKSSSVFLPLLLVGNSVQAASWIAGAPLLGCGWVRTWLTFQVISAAIRYLAVTTLLPVFGTQAIPFAFLISQLFDLVTSLVVCSRRMKITTPGVDLARIGFSAALPGVLALIGLHATPITFIAGLFVLTAGAAILVPDQFSRLTLSVTGIAIRYCSALKPKAL
jgi:O-antigen/teichoic acid export membrane protein